MTPANLFNLCNTLALCGWIILIALPFWKQADKFILGVIITLLAILYAGIIIRFFHLSDTGKFGTLAGVASLFENEWLLLAGWIHYLAFDLLTGLFIRRNAATLNIPHLYLVPCLFFTFMLGPVGLLLYLLIRFGFTKKYFAENS